MNHLRSSFLKPGEISSVDENRQARNRPGGEMGWARLARVLKLASEQTLMGPKQKLFARPFHLSKAGSGAETRWEQFKISC